MKKLFLAMFGVCVFAGWTLGLTNAAWGFFNDANVHVDEINTWWTADNTASEGFIGVVQKVINWVLWILWLIALILLIWWGFQMVTAAWDDAKYKKWFTIMKQAAIWLAVIGFAWFIVSIILRVIWVWAA